jgi:Kef-type K+ transport system membrane component KefB
MNEILAVGLILAAALAAGRLAHRFGLPEVTAYLLVGILIGPASMDLVTHEAVLTLEFLSEIALGFILFGIGAIFEAETFRRVGRAVVRIALMETSLTFVLVFTLLLAVGTPLPVALFLGVIAMETAPATTLMVVREYDAKGPLTDRLLALLALNNMIVLAAFGVAVAALEAFSIGIGDGIGALIYRTAYRLFWPTVGGIAFGMVLGLLLDAAAARITEHGEGITLAVAAVLLAVGGGRALGLSPLFTTLAMGATMANASAHSAFLISALGRIDPPLFATFFVLAGAELRPSAVAEMGAAGLVYVMARPLGKVIGVRFALRRVDVPDAVRGHLGRCIISSSSLALGLSLQVRRVFPEFAQPVSAVALAAVLVFEVVGPLLARRSLIMAGEAGADVAPAPTL